MNIKNILKKTAASIAFLTGLAVLLALVSAFFLPKNNMKAFGMEEPSANGILGERADSIDVLVLGDSESYSSISPMQMWGQQGITSYVCGTPGQFLYESENYLHQAFENQTPKVVILETNAIYRNFTPEAAVMNRVENLFSIFRYHDRWKSLNFGDLSGSVNYTWMDDFKGYRYNDAVDGADGKGYMAFSEKAAVIRERNWQYVADMAQLCRDYGAEFLLVSTPSTVNWNYERHNGIAELARACGIRYIDMNLMGDVIPINWASDTRDKGDHLNHSGAVKVSAWLGAYLKENYRLEDHRNDPAYEKWNESLKRYQKAVNPGSSAL